jgi:uncharacterized short protein YbdD (DUF466 family)
METATLQQTRDATQARGGTLTKPSGRVRILLRRLWSGIRDWCGDSAYERYLIAVRKRNMSSTCPPLSRDRFYVEQLNRRYSRPNRCC